MLRPEYPRVLTERPDWAPWVVSRGAREQPIHRWLLFPHSFRSELVRALISEWGLGVKDRVLDPFVGAGTTLVAAREAGVPSEGYDLSPLSVLVANAKVSSYRERRLESIWQRLQRSLKEADGGCRAVRYAAVVHRALPEGRLDALAAVAAQVRELKCAQSDREFFQLALAAVVPEFSDAKANGGWLRWSKQGAAADGVFGALRRQVEMMIADVKEMSWPHLGDSQARLADARLLPVADGTYSAVITSPPYPNRHDYSRIFGVELMLLFQNWEENRAFRYQSFHSHPEARPVRPLAQEYRAPEALAGVVDRVVDKRVRRMLRGYFLDMYLCLREVARVCREGAKVALVVGNAQYDGLPILVDEMTAELGEEAGLFCTEIRAVRWRGNSAQQMGRFGRVASRESVVMFEKPCS